MTRTFVALGLAVGLGLTLVGPSAVASASQTPLPTHTYVTDGKNDVLKDRAPAIRRSADLDITRVAAWVRGDNVLVRVKVADLKPGHLKDSVHNGVHSIAANVSAFIYFGNLRWQIGYGLFGEPDATAMLLNNPDKELKDPMCGFSQHADYGKNTVTFTLPIECLPVKRSQARINGITSWVAGKKRIPMWDDFYPRGDYSKPEKRSTPFRFR